MYFVLLFLYALSLVTTVISISPIHPLCLLHLSSYQNPISKENLWILATHSRLNTRVCCCSFVSFLNEKECIKDLSLRTHRMRGWITVNRRCQQGFGLGEADGCIVTDLADLLCVWWSVRPVDRLPRKLWREIDSWKCRARWHWWKAI